MLVSSTVKSRYNGFQGTRENCPLLPKSVIAKMTMVDCSLRKKPQKIHQFRTTKAAKSCSSISFAVFHLVQLFISTKYSELLHYSPQPHIDVKAISSKDGDCIL